MPNYTRLADDGSEEILGPMASVEYEYRDYEMRVQHAIRMSFFWLIVGIALLLTMVALVTYTFTR